MGIKTRSKLKQPDQKTPTHTKMMQQKKLMRPEGGVDTSRQPAGAMLEQSPASPMKGRRGLTFSHFSRRYRVKLAESDVFHMRFNSDASLGALSFFDGSLQIVSTMFGDVLYTIKDDEMTFPITSLTWKPTFGGEKVESQKLLGACLDGSIIRWTYNLGS